MSSKLLRNVAIAGGLGGAAIFLLPRTMSQANPVGNVFETQGVKNIGDRYSAGGGSNTHQTGVATTRGKPEINASNQDKHHGVGTAHFEDTVADQKLTMSSPAGKAYKEAYNGSEKGK